MGTTARAIERLETVAAAGFDLVTLWRQAAPLLAEAVPHYESPCFFTVDPESLLTTSHFQEGLPQIPAEWLGREYAEGDFNSMSDVLLSVSGVGTLHEATGGRPELSRKFHEEMQPFGCDQELLVALRTRDGESWGMVGLYREAGRPAFTAPEVQALRRITPRLAAGARYGLLVGQAEEPDLPRAPGLIVLDRRLGVDSASVTAPTWLDGLGGTVANPPASVLAVAGQALRSADGGAESRVRSQDGHWILLRGAALAGLDGRRQVSVILRLGIAAGTVQAHLRNIFEKTGVRSRRELVGAIFHRSYEPRVRDNEHRTAAAHPARHGPMDQGPTTRR